jgi:glyoxylase-like metal-dependent hydrolase (beta-lactamase superfamily II)
VTCHLTLILLVTLAGRPAAAQPIILDAELEIHPVESGVWQVVHRFPGECNSLLVQCDPNHFAWVDTPCTNEATQQVYEWLQRTFPDPNLIQINTGFHHDNLAGNGYLLAQGVPCYGSDLTPKLIGECWAETVRKVLPYYQRQPDKKYRDTLLSQKLVPPNKLYPLAKGLTLNVGSETVEVYFPGASHTVDNVVVYFRRHRLLYGGCMIKARAARSPGFTGDADTAAWPYSVQKVLERYPDARLVVPGHGPCGDIDLLRHTIDLCAQHNRRNNP